MTTRHVQLRAAADVAAMRTATYLGEEHLVVPVVALVGDAVIRPFGSTEPEFVPLEVLARAPAAWNGVPVVADHPAPAPRSANEPEVLEKYGFGQLFHVKLEDGRLKGEAYINTARAERMGGSAADTVARLRAGEMVEVSVGAYIVTEQRSGIAGDIPYRIAWAEAIPDHFAMLPAGARGACSVEAGCGAPRAAAEAGQQEDLPMIPKRLQEVLGRSGNPLALLNALREAVQRAAVGEGMSDSELRSKLWAALEGSVPAFDGVGDVYPESGEVFYWVWPPDEPLQNFMQHFVVGDGGEVALKNDPVEVQGKFVYEVVAGKEGEEPSAAEPRAACACEDKEGNDEARQTAAGKEDSMDKVKELAGRLIASKAAPFEESQRASLEAMGEATLTALAEQYDEEKEGEGGEPKPEEKPAGGSPGGNPQGGERPLKPTQGSDEPGSGGEQKPVTLSAEQYGHLKAAADAFHAQQKAIKDDLVTELRGCAEVAEWSEAELRAMSVRELQRLARLALPEAASEPATAAFGADYSVRGVPQGRAAASAEMDVYLNPPDPYRLKAAEQAKN